MGDRRLRRCCLIGALRQTVAIAGLKLDLQIFVDDVDENEGREKHPALDIFFDHFNLRG